MYKFSRSFIIALVLLLTTTLIANAGGWAVITLDDLPTTIAGGQTFSIGFTVRQHGQTLRSDLEPVVRFTRTDAAESFEVTAQRQGGAGHYAAEINFPGAGQWNWHIDLDQFGMITQPMPVLSVHAAQAIVPAKAVPAKTLLPPLALILDVVGAIDRMLAGKVDAATTPAQTRPPSLVAAKTAPVDQAALGKALFSTKGCVMCHQHAEVNKGQNVFRLGDTPAPDLTVNKFSADYLRSWLRDPAAIKPNTPMPDLNLQPDEIDALIAFLQAAH